MEADGWVRSTPVAQQGRPDKKVYAVAAGRPPRAGRLDRRSPRPSSSSAARWRSSSAARRTATGRPCSTQVEAHRAEHATRLAHYEQLAQRDYPEPEPLDGHDLDVYLVLRGGIRLERFWVDWLTEYLDAHASDAPGARMTPYPHLLAPLTSATSRCATAW